MSAATHTLGGRLTSSKFLGIGDDQRTNDMKAREVVLILVMLRFGFAGGSLAQTNTAIVIAPRDSFTLTDRSQIITNSCYSNSPDPVASAIVIFDVPLAATNREAFLQFNQTVSASTRPWLEIFAFEGPAAATTNIATLPKGFVASIATNDYSVRQEVDVTSWVQQLAGRRLGLQIRNAPTSRGRMSFSELKLYLVDPQTRDATPNVIVATRPPRLLDTNAVAVSASVLDVDGNLTKWQLLLDGKVVASEEFATPPASKTFWVNADLTNLAHGSHLLFFQAFSGTNAAASEPMWFFVREPRDWEHRWLGSFGNSGSFYVVDAAGRAQVWGRNESAQLGLGFRSDYVKRPVTLLPPAGERFRLITSNTNSARALTDQSTEYLWGRLYYSRPVLSDLGPISHIAMTDTQDFEIGIDGFLRGQGGMAPRYLDVRAGAEISYTKDQLGRISSVQIPTNALPVVDYAPSRPLSYAIGSDAKLYSWQPSSPSVVNEVLAPGVTGWRRVTASSALTLAIDEFGRLWEWGGGFNPDPDGKNTAAHLVSFPKAITNWLDIAVTSQIAMALNAEGELYGWGRGVPGMWNDPAVAVITKPELVSGLPDLLDPNATQVATAFVPLSVSTTNFSFKVAAQTAAAVRIEDSTNLVSWTSYTNITPQSGVASVTLPVDVTGEKFFRIAP